MPAITLTDLNNAKLDVDHIADIATSTALTATDRLGQTKRTLKGQMAAVDAELAEKLDNAQSQINIKVNEAAGHASDSASSALEAYGYLQAYRATSYGALASDPATDPLGNPPTEGDEYFNTTANLLKRWNGTTWQASDINTANLASPSGSSFVGYDGQTVQDVLDTLTGPTGAASVGYTPAGTGAVATNAQSKLREISVSVNDYWPSAGTGGDDTLYLEMAAAAVAVMGGGVVRLKRGTTYRYTRLSLRSNVVFEGEGSGSTVLQCTDSTTLDAGISIGSSIRKPDDGQRVYRAGFRNLWIGSGTSQVATLETTFQNIIGLNLCACERTVLENVSFAGFGQGAIVLARAEAGAEGLGFVNTTQDGNYNYFHNISIGSCGRYNADEAAIWFKYKANSNKFYSIFCKPVYVAFGLRGGNDNAFFGGSVESSKSISVLGSGSLGVSGNLFLGIRAEGLSSDGYKFLANAANNTVLGGYHTGVTGLDFNLTDGPNNRVLSDTTNYLRNFAFPQPTSYSTLHNLGALRVTSINGDPTNPLYIKSQDYGTVGSYPYVVMYNDITAGAAGNILGRLAWRNGDTTAGGSGISATIDGILEASGGQTGLAFSAGTGTTLTEFLRLTAAGVLRPATDNTQALGGTANRWSVVYAGTGTINTSDEREKQDIDALDDAEKRVAVSLKGLVKKFRFRDAVAEKGEVARFHVGVIAQEVMSAFHDENLDPMRYGIICYDEWDEQVIEHEALFDHRPTGEVDEAGEAIHARTMIRDAWTEVRPAGSRYGVRYEELLAFIIAAL